MAPWRNRQNASDLKSDSTNDWSVGSTPTGAITIFFEKEVIIIIIINNKEYSTQDLGFLIGTLCGDCGRNANALYCGHSIKQKEYFDIKKKRFEKIFQTKIKERRYDYPQFNNTHIYTFKTPTTDLTKYLVHLFYPNGEKVISLDALKLLTPEGIAWWYMDDGSMSIKKIDGRPRGAEITLNTYLSIEENNIIIDYFLNKYGIKWKLNKSHDKYRLRMGKKEAKNNFFPLIEPYIINCMKYKIDFNKAC